MRHYRDPYTIPKKADSYLASILIIMLSGMKYTGNLPPFVNNVLYHALGHSILYSLKISATVRLRESALEYLQRTMINYKNVFDKRAASAEEGDEASKLWWSGCSLITDMMGPFLKSYRSYPHREVNKRIVDGYLYNIAKNLLAESVLNYYSYYAPSTFIGVLAVGVVEFVLEVSQAICHKDQYIDRENQGCDEAANFKLMLQNSLYKALGSTAVKVCIATIACDQKHFISRVVVLPQLNLVVEPLANFFVGLVTSRSDLIAKPTIVQVPAVEQS